MVKLNPQQERILGRIDELHEEVVAARRTLRKRIEEQFAKEIDGLLRKRSRAANEALGAGVPKSRIGRALGTSDWGTINDILNLTADEFSPTTSGAPKSHRGWEFAYNGDEIAGVTFFRWPNQQGEMVEGEQFIALTRYGTGRVGLDARGEFLSKHCDVEYFYNVSDAVEAALKEIA